MKTKINKASSIHDQVRTTIPISIREQLKLNPGDMIDWELDKVKDEWIVIIKKIK